MRTCNKCGVEKELQEFTKKKGYKEGRIKTCKTCASVRNRQYYNDNKEKAREWHKNYYHRNKDKITQQRKVYLTNEELQQNLKEYRKVYYTENKEEMRKAHSNWMQKNKEKWNEYQKEYAKRRRRKLKEEILKNKNEYEKN